MPKKGYGQARKLSNYLGVHTTLVSQALKGLKSLTLEQASLVVDFLGLTDLEGEYFLLLVQLDRAGNESLRRKLKTQIDNLKRKSMELVNRLSSEKKLSEEMRAIFYSDWTYSAIRQLVAIEDFQDLDALTAHFGIPKKRAKEIVEFLLKTGLCREEKNRIKIGPASTHLEASSPWVRIHHINWRQKAIEQLHQEDPAKLHYTCPMTLSKKDSLELRNMIVKFLESADKLIDPSPSEELRCLNIDWFEIK